MAGEHCGCSWSIQGFSLAPLWRLIKPGTGLVCVGGHQPGGDGGGLGGGGNRRGCSGALAFGEEGAQWRLGEGSQLATRWAQGGLGKVDDRSTGRGEGWVGEVGLSLHWQKYTERTKDSRGIRLASTKWGIVYEGEMMGQWHRCTSSGPKCTAPYLPVLLMYLPWMLHSHQGPCGYNVVLTCHSGDNSRVHYIDQVLTKLATTSHQVMYPHTLTAA